MLNLITSFYLPKNKEREIELCYTLKKNIECPYIECIHLFIDDEESLNYLLRNYIELINKKIIIIDEYRQPTYSDLFAYANKLENKICFIANSDIWLSLDTDKRILSIVDDKIIFALTRYEYNNTKPLIDTYQGSHDGFIFKSPLNKDLIKHLNFYQNVLGSENVVIYELKKYNYKLFNPCYQIKIIHEHKSEIRNYKMERINRGGYDIDNVYKVRSGVVPPCKLII